MSVIETKTGALFLLNLHFGDKMEA